MDFNKFNTKIDISNSTELFDLIQESEQIAITCHVSPDGDALGSSLGLMWVLKNMGKPVCVVTPDAPPRVLNFLPGIKDIIVATKQPELAKQRLSECDLLFCMDFGEAKRVDRLEPVLLASTASKIVIDHHLAPLIEAKMVFSYPEVSSTSALLYIILSTLRLTHLLKKRGAECIYTGMMTDTGNFSYNSNDPDLYLIIADLLRKGIDKDAIYSKVMNSNTESRLRICGYGQYKMQLLHDHKAALITLNADELQEFAYQKGDTEGLVNVPLSLDAITYSVFMRQDEPDLVKVSCRSKGKFPVNILCEQHFNGGGHLNAAGGQYNGSLSQAISKFIEVIPQYDKYLSEN